MCLLLLFQARLAHAQEPPAPLEGVALSRFEPSERGSRFFYADSLELPTPRVAYLAVGAPLTFATHAATFGSRSEGERSSLVKTSLHVHPGASVVLAPGARFALDLPVALAQSGGDTALAGTRYLAPGAPRIGDLRAAFDLRLLGPSSRSEDGVTVAGGVIGWLPLGSTPDFMGDDGARFGLRVASVARSRWLLASISAGYMYRREGLLGGSLVGSEVTTTAGLAFATDAWTIGPELHGATVIEAAFAARTTPLEVLMGVRRSLGPFRLALGVGTSAARGMGAARLRTTLSFEWVYGARSEHEDRDGDGVPDDQDECPDVVGLTERRGCPAPPTAR